MNLKKYTFLFLCITCMAAFAQPKVKLDTFARGFSAPIGVENDGFTSRVFVVQQNGIIWTLDSTGTKLDTFVDLRTKVQFNGEEGLLGLAFHPNYQTNGYFYTYYTKKNSTDNLVARYKVSSNPNRAIIDSEKIVINFSHPTFTNHNGGCIRFGKDGYLYIATGDGGSGGDPNNNAQNKNSLLGKLLRLDVNNPSVTYTIPANNPFVGQSNVKTEIWAYGLRNPWRYSFDKETGDLWLADVGQNVVEEVNFHNYNSINGENYGWRCYEGNSTYNTSGCSGASNYKYPVFTYGHNGTTGGFSITGGFIYKGNKYADLRGYYIFTDYVSGNFWLTKKTDTIFNTVQQTSPKQANISSFGEDIRGELYASNLGNGVIYKIRELCSPFKISLLNKKNPSCYDSIDGLIQLTSTNNNGNVTYNWNNGNSGNTISNLGAGKYIVTATDAIGCVRKDSVILSKPDSIKINANIFHPRCENVKNGSIALVVTGGTGGNYTYNWNDGAIGQVVQFLGAGNYNVIVRDSNECFTAQSFTLYNLDTLEKPIILQSGDSIYTTTTVTSYQWKLNDTDIIGANQSIYKIVEQGNYQVEITNADGCKAISDLTPVFLTAVNNKNIFVEKFSLFPNPANEKLNIDVVFNFNRKSTLKIFNTVGQVVYTEQLQGKNFSTIISLQQFPKGIYQLSIFTEDGKVITQSFVKK